MDRKNKALEKLIQDHIRPTKSGIENEGSKQPDLSLLDTKPDTVSEEIGTISEPNKRLDAAFQPEPIFSEPVRSSSSEHDPTVVVDTEQRSDSFLKTLERKFSENWTGFFGVVLLMLGVGFLSIYTAFKMPPLYRFFMVCGVSAVMGLGSVYLKRRDFGPLLAQWTRTASVGLFLFACLGAGGIPAIQWIETMPLALFFLVVGVFVNLIVGFWSRKEFFVSMHTFFALLALSVALPSVCEIASFSVVFLTVAAFVTAGSLIWGRKERWEYNTLISLCSFSLFHFYWAILIGPSLFTVLQQGAGIMTVLLTCGLALRVHYAKLYAIKAFEPRAFWVHVMCWVCLLLGLLPHYAGSSWVTAGLSLGAVAAFFIVAQAKQLGIRWLYVTDSLIAQGISVFAIFSLFRLGASHSLILNLVFCLVCLFFVMRVFEEDVLLSKVTYVILVLSGLLTLVFHIPVVSVLFSQNLGWALTYFVGAMSVGFSTHVFLSKRMPKDALSKNHFFGVILGGSLAVCYLLFHVINISLFYFLFLAVVALFIRQKVQETALGWGMLTSVVFIGIHHWEYVLNTPSLGIRSILIRILVLGIIYLAVTFFSYVKDKTRYYSFFGIYLLAVHVLFTVYFLGKTYMPLAVGLLFLCASIILLELSVFIQRRFNHSGAYILHSGYLFVMTFIFWHFSRELSVSLLIGFLEFKTWVQIVAVSVFLYWFFARKYKADIQDLTWERVHPLFLELTVLFVTILAYVHIPNNARSLYWVGIAFLALYLGGNPRLNAPRLKTYSYLFHFVGTFQMAFVSSRMVTPSLKIWDQTWVRSLMSIVGQVGFLGYALKWLDLSPGSDTKRFWRLQKLDDMLEKKKTAFLFYPVFVGVALFLYWTFDQSILTLLWLSEAFVVFVLSIALRNTHFRLVSMAAVGGCLLRIVFYDLTNASTVARAIVFIGAGVILILMNSSYNKYKARFDR